MLRAATSNSQRFAPTPAASWRELLESWLRRLARTLKPAQSVSIEMTEMDVDHCFASHAVDVTVKRHLRRFILRLATENPNVPQILRDISAGSGDDAAGLSSRLSSLLLPLLLSGESAATWGTTASRRPGRMIREVRGSLIGGWLTTEAR